MLTNQDFINAGYTRWRPAPYNECVTDLFEKCIKDEYGKCYFIHVNRWDLSRYERNGKTNVNYESDVQFELKSGATINVKGFSVGQDWTIEEMEQFYADLWNTDKFKHYEVYEEFYGVIE